MATTRAKFVVSGITKHDPEMYGDQATVNFECRYDEDTPEDRRFCKFTPSGNIVMMITNPHVLSQLVVGDAYYVDFTKA